MSLAKLGLGLVLLVVPLATACGPSELEQLGTSGEAESALTSDVDCTREREPAYSGGQQIGTVDVVRIGNKRVTVKTAHAFLHLQRLADAQGIDVSINSGFRTMSEQQYFYDCYKTKRCNNGNLAAKPGYSNHQNGRALDLGGDRAQLNRLIERNGLDWRRTVAKEPWHYEYFGPWVNGPCGSETGEAEVPLPPRRPDDLGEPAASSTCIDDAACNPGHVGRGLVCEQRRCVPGCSEDWHCPGSTECIDGECM
jgi:hypothetical protein